MEQQAEQEYHPAEFASVASEARKSNMPTLHHSAFTGDVITVRQCLNEGANVNEAIELKNKSGDVVVGVTPLFLAAQQGQDAVVKLLLELGADPSLKCFKPNKEENYGPLDVAMTNLHLKVWWTLTSAIKGKNHLVESFELEI